MPLQYQLFGLIILTISMVVISLTKSTRGKPSTKSWLKKITIYGYIQAGIAILIITGLFFNFKNLKEARVANYLITQKYDDSLYSLSKQLTAHKFSYNKQTNTISPNYIETPGLKMGTQWSISSGGNKTAVLMVDVSLINTSSYPVSNIKGKIFYLTMIGKRFNNPYRSYKFLSAPGIPPGSSLMSLPFISVTSILPNENLVCSNVEYEDEDGFSRNPIREIYLMRNVAGDLIQPRRILDSDSLHLIEAYLTKNNMW